MNLNFNFANDIAKTSSDIWNKGWAERNAGNISMRLSADNLQHIPKNNFNSSWRKLDIQVKNLMGEYFLISGTGKYIRNIPVNPEENLGIIEIDDIGERYRIVWGFANGGNPTSELSAHLVSHSVRKDVTNGVDRCIIHTHPTNLIALTYALNLDTASITKLLWEMHAECITVFPEGAEYLPWMMAGSKEIADETAKAFLRRLLVIWEHHGVFASGSSLDVAFGIIDTAEKAAEIYIKAISAGGIKKTLSIENLVAIAHNFGFKPAQDIIDQLSKIADL